MASEKGLYVTEIIPFEQHTKVKRPLLLEVNIACLTLTSSLSVSLDDECFSGRPNCIH